MDHPQYKRILLKLSGEALMGEAGYGIDPQMLETFASEVETIYQLGVEIGIVIGGGNIYRGIQAAAEGIHKVTGDHMGMLATVMNALAMQSALENRGITTRLQTAIKMEQIAEPFIRRRAVRHLEKGRVVIFGAGTGNPYFTTDTAAALRAIEIEAGALIMGKNGVDGIYNADPRTNPTAQRYDHVTYREVHERNLRVMDLTAITLCQENRLPIIVFNMSQPGNLKRLILGEHIGTVVRGEG
ncbi:MAG: UMP kinase [Chlorobi bacterium CHB2]|nr:MAG: uridylate kinase [Chlorobi bacterium OLB7]MCE7934170.1 UMP kinase [Chlorobi bacterium CHB2]